MPPSPAPSPSRAAATVGVVVPCKNEVATIERCLRALREQDPPVARIVVVDNGSTDGSLQVAARLADAVVEIAGGSISTLRNQGAAALGRVDVLAFVDADTEVHPGWLAAGLDALNSGADLVGSRTRASGDARWVARRWAAVEAARAHGGSRVWSQHMLIRADRFAALGGFAALPTGEDADLSIRTETAGGVVGLVPGMVATHHGFPETYRAFLRRERWHTRAPGWLPRMSTGSRFLVYAGAAWTAVGAVVLGDAMLRRRPKPLRLWAGASTVTVPLLGSATSRNPVTTVQDGVLVTTWAAVRIARLPREFLRLRHDRGRDVTARPIAGAETSLSPSREVRPGA